MSPRKFGLHFTPKVKVNQKLNSLKQRRRAASLALLNDPSDDAAARLERGLTEAISAAKQKRAATPSKPSDPRLRPEVWDEYASDYPGEFEP